MTIEEYFGDWSRVIDTKEADRIIKKLVSSRQVTCPKIKDIFKAFTLCPLQELKVLILGQDPYNTYRNKEPVATGIAFANSKDTLESAYSPSLNILMESIIDFTLPHGKIIFDPSLEKWENQGVLLLNSALSCLVGKTGSHTLLWRPFIKSFLTKVSLHSSGIIYVLMGRDARSFKPYINAKYNHIIEVNHPSWYARNHTPMPFNLWYDINNILINKYGYGIKWYEEYKF